MATVNNNTVSNPYSIDQVTANTVNVSDATQMENNFISLMVAQIQNQDPTKPVDSTEFLNQFSAMSQVKSMENMTQLSKSNLVLLDNLQTLTASGLVGQEVKVSVDSLELGSSSIRGQLNLEHASGDTLITLTDSNGVKKELRLGSHTAGVVPFEINPAALGLAAGQYKVEATTDAGEYPRVEVSGLVTHVRVSADGPVLDVAGAGAVPFYKITEFGQTPVAGLL
ncbi:flagellar hook assembly protein FlgD [Cellvibrio sp. PSBB023]|uniref:flagellar hook assembly protein FlgD n=1 Tax=Cellvibrio sp. PSBB023 TaxID=1945512 RepID=UPI00098F3BB5|nr:flagellar hook assembly protein FlgD [Cellvibrio sp. PSBB023]AQT59851.1 flagellar basal body rod modification protein [Cellvibrio sp. PSBB023]